MAEAQSNGERRPTQPRAGSDERPPARRDAERAAGPRADDGGERRRPPDRREPRDRGEHDDRREHSDRDDRGEHSDRDDRERRDRPERGDQGDREPRRRLDAVAASRLALDALQSLTNRPAEGVVGVERDGDDWVVVIELVETARIPNTSDVLGEYEVRIGPDRELRAYQRRARYTRGSTQSD